MLTDQELNHLEELEAIPRPIETAPKDGRPVVLWKFAPSPQPSLGRWKGYVAKWEADFPGSEPYWRFVAPGIVMEIEPQYWSPLIEPPLPTKREDTDGRK